jgi:hypothetical protein
MEELTKFIKELLTKWGFHGLSEHTELIIFFIFGSGAVFFTCLWKLLKFIVRSQKERMLNKDLHPYFTPLEIKKATQYYVPTKCQNISPSKEHEPGVTHVAAVKEKLIPFFLERVFKYTDDDQRFYIILADSGMGKTTFMINLYLKYVSKWFGNKYKILLLPMGHPGIDLDIDEIKNEKKKNTILLLDAFDEDNLAIANYRTRLEEILEKTHRFRKVVITCRTQFFPSEEEEPGETGIIKYGGDKGYHYFLKFYISPFDEKDIRKYLRKKFSILHFTKKQRALQIVKSSPNLMVRPMLLSYIDDLLKSSRQYERTCEVYEELINKWIERESMRYREDRRENFKKELYKFSRSIAVDIYLKHEARKGFIINAEEIEPFAKKHQINLEHIEMKSRSLLNRNALGEYKFAHKSILEYFLAMEAGENKKFYDDLNFEDMDQAQNFYNEMWTEPILFFTQKKIRGNFRLIYEHRHREISNIRANEIKDLEYLNLNNNCLVDISPLNELKKLKTLFLNDNQITDIRVLKELKELEYLHLDHNQITDIRVIKELKGLKFLSLEHNKLTDVSTLKELKKLCQLNIKNNPIPFKIIEALKKAIAPCVVSY